MSEELIDVYQSAAKLLSNHNLLQAYKLIISEAARLAGAESGTIYLADRGILKRAYTSIPKQFRILPRKDGYTYMCYREQRVLFVDSNFVRKIHPEWKEDNSGSVIMVPLNYDNKCIGVLTLHSDRPNKYTEDEQKTMEIFGSLATLKIRNTQLYSDIQRSLELRDIFISTATHELNTPLTVVLASMELLQTKVKNKKIIEQEFISRLSSQVKRLQRLINSMLKINQIKSFDSKIINIKSCLQKAILYTRQAHPSHKIVTFDSLSSGNIKIKGDSVKITQAFINTLENAARFSPIGSEIAIVISNDDNFLSILFKDKGKGVSKNDLKTMFEGFYKGNNTQEGLGLGAYLTKIIVEAHNGTIEARQGNPDGIIVEISLPILHMK